MSRLAQVIKSYIKSNNRSKYVTIVSPREYLENVFIKIALIGQS